MKKQNEKMKKVGGRKWWLLGIGVVVFIIGVVLTPQIADSDGRVNYLIAVSVVACWVLGIGSSIYTLKGQSISGVIFNKGNDERIKGAANTIHIYARRNKKNQIIPVKIDFIWCEKPWGRRHKLENDGQYYYVHMNDLNDREMVEVALPDTVYLDPRKYIVPLTMPANEAYWKPQPATWQKLAPFAIVAGMGVLAFLFLITGG